jgi:cell division septation protein DedD
MVRQLGALSAFALALSLCPQALAATPPDEPLGGAVEADAGDLAPPPGMERRVRIILMRDGAPVGGSTSREAAAEPAAQHDAQIEAVPLEPLTAPPASSASSATVPAQTPQAPLTVDAPWTADELRTPIAAGEGWRIQVGAFRDAARAEARIAELETTAAGPGADPVRLVAPAADAQGAIFRAQMSGFVDRAAADGACARLTATGAACFVIAP